jgi:hypothetical protein
MNAPSCALFLFTALLALTAAPALAQRAPAGAQATLAARSDGLAFAENRGQWPDEVRFLARTGGADLWVTADGVVFAQSGFARMGSPTHDALRHGGGEAPAPPLRRGCMEDTNGYLWDWELELQGGTGTVTGTVDVGFPPDWIVTGTLSYPDLTVTATNPDPDGCTFETDAFTYTGAVSRTGVGTYDYGGTWESFCAGQPIGAGTFTATITFGACPDGRQSVPTAGGPAVSPTVSPASEAGLARPFEGYGLTYGLTSHPNPFSGRAAVSFVLPERADVRLSVYDGLGREVAVLVDGAREAGQYEAVLDGGALPAGVYLVRLTAGPFVQTQRVTLVR